MISMMDFESIGHYYLHEARRIVRPGDIVLKTDLYNEERDQPIKGGIIANVPATEWHAIEICEQRVRTAREKIPGNYDFGDIRTLPYADGMFDCVVDLSTIDHVLPDDMTSVIAGYARVTHAGGQLLLISWIDPLFKQEKIVNYSSTTQYYHSLIALVNEISRFYDIHEALDIVRHDGKDLIEIIATRRP
jgi:ubiquinone/menaquinone biosynthesis C-methylase UbiE